MQGTVWGSPMSTSSIDGLAKESYDQPQHMYIYKGVLFQRLELVDEGLTVTKKENTEVVNNVVDNFVEHKRLSKKKCHRIHIGKGHNNGPHIKVHGEDNEKHLGGIINHSGTIQATIDQRISKGNGIIAEI